ncbi:MAG: c-type cytochrome [Planctomycetes bacterium]|nr:c-type cytochrome [Planctomycetota bacterium]
MSFRKRFFCFAAVACALTLCVRAFAEAPEGDVAWEQDPAQWLGKKVGGAEAKPGFRVLYFRTPHEFGCRMLERISFKSPAVLNLLKERAAARHVVLDEAEGPARMYGVLDVPTLVVLDAQGGMAGAILGYRPPERLVEELSRLAETGAELANRAAELDEKLAKAEGKDRIPPLDQAAELAMERRLYAKAASLYEQLAAIPGVEETMSVTTLLARHAEALARLGRPADADAVFAKALASDALKIYAEDLAFQRAFARTASGPLEKAAPLWEEFLKNFPKSPRAETAAYNRVYCLLQAREPRNEDAAAAILALLDQNPGREAEFGLRLLLQQAGRSDAAIVRAADGAARRTYLADALKDGRDLVRAYACTDCHFIVDPGLPVERNACVTCHLTLKRMEKDTERHGDFLKAHPHFYRNCTRIRHTLRAPNLIGVGARVKPGWTAKYLANPYDVRPHLEESMVQMNLSDGEIATLVRYLRAIAESAGRTPPDEGEDAGRPAPAAAEIAAGRALFVEQKCYTCHQFGNARFGPEQGTWSWEEGRAEAPNLRFARERLTERTAAEWIQDPERMSPATRMPKFELKPGQIKALVAFLFHGDPGPKAEGKAPREAKKLEHPPTWDEVNAAVFKDTCIHCHMADDAGGAGNIGAYGFRARRLDLSSYAGIRRGSLQADGKRIDVLAKREGGLMPLLLERVYRRVEENKRDKIEPFMDPLTDLNAKRDGEGPQNRVAPGMPYGHPALTAEQIALLEAWIDAGAPGPKPAPMEDPVQKKLEQGE